MEAGSPHSGSRFHCASGSDATLPPRHALASRGGRQITKTVLTNAGAGFLSSWHPWPLERCSTLLQGDLRCLAPRDREREPQFGIERDSEHVIAKMLDLDRVLTLRLRHQPGAIREEPDRQRLPAGQLQ